MLSRRSLSVLVSLIFSVIFIVPLPKDAEAGGPQRITGVWSCGVTRPGSTIARPLSYVFHSDGIVTSSSQATINGGPLALPFTSSGGGYGEWEKIRRNDFAFRARENLYINGNAGGFLYVDSIQRLDQASGQLCSGRSECPNTETKIRITQFTFTPDGSIAGEVDLLPPGSTMQILCEPLSKSFPGLP